MSYRYYVHLDVQKLYEGGHNPFAGYVRFHINNVKFAQPLKQGDIITLGGRLKGRLGHLEATVTRIEQGGAVDKEEPESNIGAHCKAFNPQHFLDIQKIVTENQRKR